MKAITCSQCGALIKRISLKDKFAFCDYCGAKILLSENKDKIVEIPDKKVEKNEEKELTPWEQHQENYRKVKERADRYNDSYTYPQSEDGEIPLPLFFGGFGLFILFFMLFVTGKCDSTPTNLKNNSQITKNNSQVTNSNSLKIDYEVRINWEGKYDLEHYERPQIDTSKLPTSNEDELKKTVFKERNVQVKVKINTDGEVTSAEAISGHPVLREAALKAAKKTIFSHQAKPTDRILNYYFTLVGQ